MPNKKLLNYGAIEQLKDVAPYIVLSCVMATIVYAVGQIDIPILLSLLVQIITGITIYLISMFLFRPSELNSIFQLTKPFIKSKKK